MYCQNCGTNLSENASFCVKCGCQIPTVVAPSQTNSANLIVNEKLCFLKKITQLATLFSVVAIVGGTILIRLFAAVIIQEGNMSSYDEKEFMPFVVLFIILNLIVSIPTAIVFSKMYKKVETLLAHRTTQQTDLQAVYRFFEELKTKKFKVIFVCNIIVALSPAILLYVVQIYACNAIFNTKKQLCDLCAKELNTM